jgi:hypothetical protein
MDEDLQKEVGKYGAIEAVLNSEGGKLLKEYLEENFSELLLSLLTKYKYLKPDELTPIISKIDSTLELLEKLTGAERNKQMILDTLK